MLFLLADIAVSPENYSTLFVADGIASLFARPGVMSDSWIITGILRCFAANTTGTETNPPLEKTISGFNFSQQSDCLMITL